MKKAIFLIFTIILAANFTLAQKTSRKKTKVPKPVSVLTEAENNAENNKTDSPLKILHKPKAAYPKPESNSGTVCVQGTVTLRIQFLATGKIGEIKVISGLPYGLTESAVETAKKIKFKPAVKDGKAVNVTRIIPFSFTIY